MTDTPTMEGQTAPPINPRGGSAPIPAVDLREKKSRRKPEAACAHCGGSIERRKCPGRPRKFCEVCVPSGSAADVAAAWRQVNEERIEAYRLARWEREREERQQQAEQARLAHLAALRAQAVRVQAYRLVSTM